MIGIVVDSNSQMPAALAHRYGIVVVPLTVTVDGVDYREGIDIDADRFYAAWADGHVPTVETSQPSPGAFVDAYRTAIAAGATEILSVHISEAMSGTLNSARLGAQQVDVPVRLVDSGTASFGISCCAWAAADAIAAGADLEAAAEVAQRRGAELHTNFVVGVPQLVERSGRAEGLDVASSGDDKVAVLAMTGPALSVLGRFSELESAVAAMVEDALARPASSDVGLMIAVGMSDVTSAPVATGLQQALGGHPLVAEVIEYRIGPSVGAHTGPGTAGLFVF